MNPVQQRLVTLLLFSLAASVAAGADDPPAAPAATPAATPAAAPTPDAAAVPASAATPDAATQQKSSAKTERAASKTGKTGLKSDYIALGTTTVTGNRELPKVLYIVPWKKSDIGDLAGKPMNSLLDEVLAPVDRDVFRREVVYYHALSTAASQNGAQAGDAAKQVEK